MAAGLPLVAKFQSRLTTNLVTTNLDHKSPDHKSPLRSSITEGAGGLGRFREVGPQLSHCHDPQSYRFGLGERIGDNARTKGLLDYT